MPCANGGCGGGGCCLIMVAVWFFVASGLLYLTWNKVITTLFKVNSAKVWHAFLVVLTLMVFCLPSKMNKRGCGAKSCCSKAGCKYKRGNQNPPAGIPDTN